jgi:hypothetical protein
MASRANTSTVGRREKLVNFMLGLDVVLGLL